MSYFVAGVSENTSLLESGSRALQELTEGDLYAPQWTHKCGQTYMTNVPAKKTVPDLFWVDKNSESWLLISGMPVLLGHFANCELEKFAAELFLEPINTLRAAIDGHFGLIGYDSRSHNIYIATDMNSLIPIYYASDSEGLYFSSSELILARHLQAPLDSLGVAQSLFLGSTYDAYTRFKGIRKLRAAELVVGRLGEQFRSYAYWSPSDENIWKGSFDDVIDRWLPILRRSVSRFPKTSGEKIISADLTAGEDSRLIVSLCHDQGIAITTRVTGLKGDVDVLLATKIAKKIDIPISVVEAKLVDPEMLFELATTIARKNDGYGSIFSAAIEAATNSNSTPPEYSTINLCGTPGGNIYRGAYYLRARVLFPSWQRKIDYKLLLKMKFLFDYDSELIDGGGFLEQLYADVKERLGELEGFPAGTKVDHVVRYLAACVLGINIKRPFYLPFGLRDMTRSIYQIPPNMKQGSKLTRACTERLFPELARIPTKNGIPTLRMTLFRIPLFIPGYVARVKSIYSGVMRRILKSQYFERMNISVDAQHHRLDYHLEAINMFLQREPYATWFSSVDQMYISEICNKDVLMDYFESARQQSLSRVQLFGKLLNLELACRWVYNVDKS